MEIKKFEYNQLEKEKIIEQFELDVDSFKPITLSRLFGEETPAESQVPESTSDLIQDNTLQTTENARVAANIPKEDPTLIKISPQDLEAKLQQARQESYNKAKLEFEETQKNEFQKNSAIKESIEVGFKQIFHEVENQFNNNIKIFADILKNLSEKIALTKIVPFEYFENLSVAILNNLRHEPKVEITIHPDNLIVIEDVITNLAPDSTIKINTNTELNLLDFEINFEDGLISSKYQDRINNIYKIIDNFFTQYE
ncbi:FliH/SctL family protein [Rickettsiales endosymbiont of Stachyamoeba lipophora]|uniref:hypothetical protein n=1 Tax=Rickettsiales endosymbiont of Stachyamoeba lipophora TaxID=2486578 RepID=UPI0013DE07AB|nr:hypothetical protein [Rickettsiales endosymbiont of Stachyamoeba lipophora]